MADQLTISDIASKAGVSKTTVSRVLNNSASVKKATRDKVLAVIQRENYSPSSAARSLSKRVSDTIGVIVPQLNNPFFGEILSGITEILDAYNLTMLCMSTDDNIEKDLASLANIKNHQVRGLLYTPAVDYVSSYVDKYDRKRVLSLLHKIRAPIVLMDRQLKGLDLDGIFFDDTKGVYNATKALIDKGHTKIGIINAPLGEWSLARIRQKGFEDAMRDAGLPVEQRYIFAGDYRMSKSYELSKELLAMKDRPTAVITCNNWTSMGFLKAVHECGESVPEDISCIGLDRIEALDIVGLNFNFIERDAVYMGKKAMELLINRIAFPDRPKQNILIDPPVVIRKL